MVRAESAETQRGSNPEGGNSDFKRWTRGKPFEMVAAGRTARRLCGLGDLCAKINQREGAKGRKGHAPTRGRARGGGVCQLCQFRYFVLAMRGVAARECSRMFAVTRPKRSKCREPTRARDA
jgi:hypothetical protein